MLSRPLDFTLGVRKQVIVKFQLADYKNQFSLILGLYRSPTKTLKTVRKDSIYTLPLVPVFLFFLLKSWKRLLGQNLLPENLSIAIPMAFIGAVILIIFYAIITIVLTKIILFFSRRRNSYIFILNCYFLIICCNLVPALIMIALFSFSRPFINHYFDINLESRIGIFFYLVVLAYSLILYIYGAFKCSNRRLIPLPSAVAGR